MAQEAQLIKDLEGASIQPAAELAAAPNVEGQVPKPAVNAGEH